MIISFSQYSMFKQCPWRWHLYRAHTPVSREADAKFYPGSLIHKLNEDWLKDRPQWSDLEIMDRLAKIADFLQTKTPNPLPKDESFFRIIIDNFRPLQLKEQEWLANHKFTVEDSFNIPIDKPTRDSLDCNFDIEVIGASDILVFANRPFVVDLKFTVSDRWLKRDQLLVYFYALSIKYKMDISSGLFYLIGAGKSVPVEEKPGEREEFIKDLVRAARVMNNDKDPDARPGGMNCMFCPYSHCCTKKDIAIPGMFSWKNGQ